VALGRVLRQRLAMLEIDARALRYAELGRLLEEAVELAAHGARTEMAKILVLQPDGDLLVAAGHNLKPGVVGHATVPPGCKDPASECVRAERVVSVGDLPRSSKYERIPLLAAHEVVSTVNVPIIVASGTYGVLEVDSTKARDFDVLDESFLIGIAGIIGEGAERVRREGVLNRALSARDVLLREHHHRVRNNYQVLIGALAKHAREVASADARDRFQQIQRRLFALASVYDHLVGAAGARTVMLQDFLLSLCDSLRDFYALGEQAISLAFRADDNFLADIDVASALGVIVNELVANSVEHAFEGRGGQIMVALEREATGGAFVSVADNGEGYRPSATESVGLTTVRRLVSQIDAALDLTSDAGTVWKVRVPPERLNELRSFGASKPSRSS
jgi:two-component sensor histidine kinase